MMTIDEATKMLTAKVECMKRETSGEDIDCNYRNCDECELCYAQGTVGEQKEALKMAIEALRNSQASDGDCITDEQAIEHLQSTGWMQNHDREMYESGLRKQLADDSGGYDALIPSEDTISRQAAIDGVKVLHDVAWKNWHDPTLSSNVVIDMIKDLPSAQPKINNQINLCDSCTHTYPDCPAGKEDVLFGNSEVHDNICACNKYEVHGRQEIELDCDTCKHSEKQWDEPPCDGCCKGHSGYEPKERNDGEESETENRR